MVRINRPANEIEKNLNKIFDKKEEMSKELKELLQIEDDFATICCNLKENHNKNPEYRMMYEISTGVTALLQVKSDCALLDSSAILSNYELGVSEESLFPLEDMEYVYGAWCSDVVDSIDFFAKNIKHLLNYLEIVNKDLEQYKSFDTAKVKKPETGEMLRLDAGITICQYLKRILETDVVIIEEYQQIEYDGVDDYGELLNLWKTTQEDIATIMEAFEMEWEERYKLLIS